MDGAEDRKVFEPLFLNSTGLNQILKDIPMDNYPQS